MGSCMFVQEFDKRLFGSTTLVRNRGFDILAFGEVLDRRIAGDTLFSSEGTGVFGFGVYLGDYDGVFKNEIVGQGFPGWG